jgi:hypothetical protein
MEAMDTRYDPINALWSSLTRPAISRLEAERAARRIYRHFGAVALGGPLMTGAARFSGTVRRCWITPRVNDGLDKGWPRLVHDVSHRIFARRHPNFRPHAGGHAVLEREITEYVIEQGWLTGKLKPAAARKATPQERRDKRLAQTEAAIARWESKRRRADNALKKLRRRHRAQRRQQVLDAQVQYRS